MLTSDKKIILKAYQQNYAIAQVNINNLEWTTVALQTAQELNSPVILGVSEGAAKYMGGLKTVVAMVRELDTFYKISVPIILHLDHGSYNGALQAIEAGFTSIMFDGSHFDFATNLSKTKEMTKLCHDKGLLIEAEVGGIGGEEDGIIGQGEIADPEECKQIADVGIDMLAAGIGNIHGKYPANWTGLNFKIFAKIKELTNGKIPLVLHGGTGIPEDMIKTAISLGVVKINVNTEFQLAFAQATRQYIEDKKDLIDKGFDPRKLLRPGMLAIKELMKYKLSLFGSVNKA
ncbi:class II fructose-1,6-bisphosphate aldolase [Candidatus Phytoplasma solani]|uniref:Fructose-bisphosphate aldolase, class II n=1 Tax=Candidatus Phytoplasma solani TaxID=69896 RepID=A0A421NXN1_9MOLU|nr:class II fructose-1,6-bisphosphate aldolase [Candidatus Phytoplasma solani]RMI88752.1 fructose-bisphosphate aldolase, class II [Candidatus Phytoplasma solani]CCP88269.1 Fructose-bisphosphate aldolase [Candidatus Phytoplasma solani]